MADIGTLHRLARKIIRAAGAVSHLASNSLPPGASATVQPPTQCVVSHVCQVDISKPPDLIAAKILV